jgi:DNA ligase-1
MNSNDVYALIEQVAATSSKNEKEALLKANASDYLLKRVLEYAYNPFKTYGIRKRPETLGDNVGNTFDDGTFELLDDLISRKLTGTAAIEALRGELTALSKSSAELLWRIVNKDVRAGFSESTCNKVWKGLIPDFPYMRCSLPKDAKLDQFDWTLGVVSQEKADGMFVNLDYEADGTVRITSRQGSPFPIEAFELLETEVKARLIAGLQYHGEMLVARNGEILPREIGNGIMNSIASGGSF